MLKQIVDILKDKVKVVTGEKHRNTAAQHIKSYENEKAAMEAFEQKKNKLMNIHEWSNLSGPENADFVLCDSEGNPDEDGMARKGSYIKIDLPGPLPMYWVSIEEINNVDNKTEIILRPCKDPSLKKEPDDARTDHFFRKETINILGLERKGKSVIAYQQGKNEIANNEGPEAGGQSAVNTSVVAGGVMGIQQHQWETFTKNLSQS